MEHLVHCAALDPDRGPCTCGAKTRAPRSQEKLVALAWLVLHETSEDSSVSMPHEPREALLILRNAAKSALEA